MIKKFSNFIKENPVILIIIILGAVIMEYGFNEGREDYRIIDGDTIVLNGEKIRLRGMDAPEMKQSCRNSDWKKIQCGEIAKGKLIEMIGDNKVICDIKGKDRYKRKLGYCYVGTLNLNQEMVKRGYAVSYSKYDTNFVADERVAREKKLGFWAGKFENPEKWRRKQNKNNLANRKRK